eukprot:6108217-Prymnesium_polylepis.1
MAQRRHPDKFIYGAWWRPTATRPSVPAAHSRQTASRHRVLDTNALASRDARLVTRQLRGAATAAAD